MLRLFAQPAVTHTVDGFDGVEVSIYCDELAANTFDVRRDGVVVENCLCGVHELLAVFNMARVSCHRMYQPKLR